MIISAGNDSHRSSSYPVDGSPVSPEDLATTQLFQGVKVPQIQELLNNPANRFCTLKANKRLLLNRDRIDHVYLILTGYVVIWASSRFNRRRAFLAWRGPGQIIGEMRPLEDAEPSSATITTCDPCTFLEMTNKSFVDLANRSRLIYRNVAHLLVKKMVSERHRSEVIRATPVERKVAQTLLFLADERCGKDELKASGPLTIPGTIHQKELGAYAGVERETVNHPLVALKEKEIISYDSEKRDYQITIRNRPELEKLAKVRLKSARKERS